MAFTFEAERPLAKRVVKLLLRELDEGIAILGGSTLDDDALHDLRRCGKRSRSLIRLVSAGLPHGGRALDKAWRGIARATTDVRDATAMAQTLAKLLRRDARLAALEGSSVTERLDQHRAEVRHGLAARTPRLTTALVAVRRQVSAWRPACGWKDAVDGLVGAYRRSRRAAHRAGRHLDPEERHAWRKRAKDVALAVALLGPLWPEMMVRWEESWADLGKKLGHERDLGVLLTFLRALPTPAEAAALIRLAEWREQQVRREADLLGSRLHIEPTACLDRRVRGYALLSGLTPAR